MKYKYLYYESIDSTNSEARRLIGNHELEGPVLIVANEQLAGRGRQGRSFFSPAAKGLYMTLAVPMSCPISSQVTITTRVAVAVSRAIEKIYSVCRPQIKWVNDIYLKGRKVCGILCEAISSIESGMLEWIIIGVGINISTTEWPDDIRDRAGSIEALGNIIDSGKNNVFADKSDPGELATAVCDEIIAMLSDMSDTTYLDYYRERSNVIGHIIEFTENGITRSARAIDIDDMGGLIAEISDNDNAGERVTLNSGEITVRVDS